MSRAFEFYETPMGCTEALLANEVVRPAFQATATTVLDPCSGDHAILWVITRLFPAVETWTNDINPDMPAETYEDATTEEGWERILAHYGERPAWIVTNPPWSLAHKILPHALEAARIGVAFHLPLRFQEPTQDREEVLREHPWSLQITFGQPRPSYTEDGRTDSATSFWAVWLRGLQPMPVYYVTDPDGRWRELDLERFKGRRWFAMVGQLMQ